MKQILIYKDFGADPIGVSCVVESLRQASFDRSYAIGFADRHLLKDPAWRQDACLLIFPGGRDIPYQRALQGPANKHISDFVRSGGGYLGICAGGYYGSASIEFEKGFPLEVVEDRELKFFPGVARGSAYGGGEFCYRTGKGGRIARLELASREKTAAYFQGGCAFVDAEIYPAVTVLARYCDIDGAPPAIVQCQVDKGRAVLSGVHPEYGALHSGVGAQLGPEQCAALRDIELQRLRLFALLVESALA